MFDDRGPSDPVRYSKTQNIEGELIEPDDIRVVCVKNQDGEKIGFLIKWDAACWIYSDEETRVDLSENL